MSVERSAPSLAERLRAGDRRSLARAISLVENCAPQAESLMAELHAYTGRAYVVGITGPPGAGKSTLVDALVTAIRASGESVGVIAVDPTSPFTGGAVLGDRVRMTTHTADPGVFVRSMATRGNLGGLARAAGDVASLLDAAGFDNVLIETVGVGQDEVDIAGAADVSVLVLVPGAGDDMQAIKAGVMEIADIFVVNKADREGADQVTQTIRAALALAPAGTNPVPVMKTVATTSEGVAALLGVLRERRTSAIARRSAVGRNRELSRLYDLIVAKFRARFERVIPEAELARVVDDVVARRIDPYSLATQLFNRTLAGEERQP